MDPQGLGIKETRDSIIRLPGYPFLSVGDIICSNIDGTRYNVMLRSSTYFPGTGIPVSQKATIRVIPQSDTVYNLQVPVNLDE
jgi:hypothetical protein